MNKNLSTLSTLLIVLLLLVFLPWGRLPPFAQDQQDEFTSVFPISDCVFVNLGTNDFFNITPGRFQQLNNLACFQAGQCDSLEEIQISVLGATNNIVFQFNGQPITADTRVVETLRTVDGRLVETSRSFYAECQNTGDVYHFGKTVQSLTEDGTASTQGSWLAGVDGALPGLAFPGGAFLLGSKYFQEVAPEVALNRAEHVASGLDVTVPFGTFTGCVEVRETSGLDRGTASTKIYCPGTGLVVDGDVELVDAIGSPELVDTL